MATDLWMVIAIVPRFRLDGVTRALEELPGFGGLTVSDCRGFGHERLAGETAEPGDAPGIETDLTDFKPRVKLEAVVAGRAAADAIVAAIAQTAHTGRGGDGKIFLIAVEQAVRIRTLAVDHDAL